MLTGELIQWSGLFRNVLKRIGSDDLISVVDDEFHFVGRGLAVSVSISSAAIAYAAFHIDSK